MSPPVDCTQRPSLRSTSFPLRCVQNDEQWLVYLLMPPLIIWTGNKQSMCWTGGSDTAHCTSIAGCFGRASLVVYVVFWTFMPTSLLIWHHFKTHFYRGLLWKVIIVLHMVSAGYSCWICVNNFLYYFSACDYLWTRNEFVWQGLRNNNWLHCNCQRIEAQLHLWTWKMCYCEQRCKNFSVSALLTLDLSQCTHLAACLVTVLLSCRMLRRFTEPRQHH